MTRILFALAGTVALGLLSRFHPIGWYPYDKTLWGRCPTGRMVWPVGHRPHRVGNHF